MPDSTRDIAMVFQSYALYQSMTVRENIAFGLGVKKVPKAEQKEIVERVVMGRALTRKPSLFLFDEPLSNLDAKLRVAVMKDGVVQQFGSPSMNFVHCTLQERGGKVSTVIDNAGVKTDVVLPFSLEKLRPHIGRKVILGYVRSRSPTPAARTAKPGSCCCSAASS